MRGFELRVELRAVRERQGVHGRIVERDDADAILRFLRYH
jgi:hypothetical protein